MRFSVSVEGDLLELFDKYREQEQFATRSEAVRQLIRDTLTRRRGNRVSRRWPEASR